MVDPFCLTDSYYRKYNETIDYDDKGGDCFSLDSQGNHWENRWSFLGGVCWKHCLPGYTDDGLTCYNGIPFDVDTHHSYISASVTDFSDKVGCKKS